MTAVAFSVAEIAGEGVSRPSASLVSVARELEAYASVAAPTPSPALASRINAEIAREATPTPPVLFWRALTQGSTAAAFGYLATSARAALGIGRMFPAAVRAQAIALLLAVAIALLGGGAALAAGAATVLQALQPRHAPEIPAVVDRSATPSPDRKPDRDHPTEKPKDATPGNGGAGAGPRGGSGDDRDDGDDEDADEHKDDDGRGSNSSPGEHSSDRSSDRDEDKSGSDS
jgi:hypothetical protein